MILPVIIASYNRPNLIKQLIDSIYKNSYYDIKIVVVDNSTDPNTIDYIRSLKDIILYRWGNDFPHLRVESPDGFNYPAEQKPSPYWTDEWSLGKSRTKGVMLSPPSKYIYFSDNDMYLTKNWDKIMIDALNKYEDLVIIGGSGQHSHGDDGRPVGKNTVYPVSLQVGNTMMWRRKEWDRIGFFPDHGEDGWISLEATTRFNKTPGVLDPPVALHCGATSLFSDDTVGRGVVNRGKLTPTHPNANIELNKREHPELIYE